MLESPFSVSGGGYLFTLPCIVSHLSPASARAYIPEPGLLVPTHTRTHTHSDWDREVRESDSGKDIRSGPHTSARPLLPTGLSARDGCPSLLVTLCFLLAPFCLSAPFPVGRYCMAKEALLWSGFDPLSK